MSYATTDRNRARFLLIHGTADDVVDPVTQSQAFQNALKQAGICLRRFVIPGAGHFWASDPFEGEIGGYGATVAPTNPPVFGGRAVGGRGTRSIQLRPVRSRATDAQLGGNCCCESAKGLRSIARRPKPDVS